MRRLICRIRLTIRLAAAACCASGLFIFVCAGAPGFAETPAPDLPAAPADPAGLLSRPRAPLTAPEASLVTVETPGRFALRARSGSGVGLQLVDRMTGPGTMAGVPGERDGRLDALLDRGVYRLTTFGAKGASGEAELSLSPFHSAAPASAALLRGGDAAAGLADLEQRFYWTLVGADGAVSVEAAGRALGDLRLWRNGVDLESLQPKSAAIEAEAGRPMTRLRLEGSVEPGLYLIAVYGGAPAVWADGGEAQPLYLRVGPPRLLAGGWFEGKIGPSGSERFAIPAPASYVRLELPEPAAAQLSVARGEAAPLTASLSKTSRVPSISLNIAPKDQEPAVAEVSGLAGQAFRLRALEPAPSPRIEAAGPYLIAADVAGAGGDELPATLVLARFAKGKATVLASTAPRVAQGGAFRAKFNLRGASSLIFEIASAGPVALRTEGPRVAAMLEPLLGGNAPRADGENPRHWDVEAGWYRLKLDPVRDSGGVLDLVFGQPGLLPEVLAAPLRPTVDFGVQTVEKGASLQIFANEGPNLAVGVRARKLPADLALGPLALDQRALAQDQARPAQATPTPDAPAAPEAPPLPPKRPPAAKPLATPQDAQKAGAQKAGEKAPRKGVPAAVAAAAPGALVIPLRAPKGGAIAAFDVNGQPVGMDLVEQSADDAGRTLVATIAAAPRDRRVVILWSKAPLPAAVPSIADLAATPALKAGETRSFDLARGESRAFRLEIPESGLYRIETLGRLKTSLSIGSAFSPALDQASDNGAGHNGLLQSYLRAGSYRVNVKALDCEGRLGLVAQSARLAPSGRLAPQSSARAALSGGVGAVFDVETPQAGDYRLDLYALGKDLPARLEDLDGWPLTPPGPLRTLTRRFEAGRYRLVAPPVETDARVLARLQAGGATAAPQGHGPNALAFGAPGRLQWREPISGQPRTPDAWTFSLQGAAHVTLSVSEGMTGELVRVAPAASAIAKISTDRGFEGELAKGDYRVDVTAAGRNDRLDYQIALDSAELQPDAPRFATLPLSLPFTIADDRIVSLASYGSIELNGVIKDSGGRIVERLSGRPDDWNVSFSRLLPAGAYRVELAALQSAPASAEDATADDQAGQKANDEANDDASDEASDGEARDEGGAPAAAAEGDADSTSVAVASKDQIELRLALPETKDGPALEAGGVARLEASEAVRLALPQPAAGALLVAAAEASADAVLSLERQDEGGVWRALGFDRGRAPFVAAAGDGDAKRPWRASVWPVEGAARITVAAQIVDEPPQQAASATLKPIPIEGMNAPVEVAAISAPGQSLMLLAEAPSGLRQGSSPGRALVSLETGALAPQSERLWLARRGAGGGALRLSEPAASLKTLSVDLVDGETATLDQPTRGEGSLRVWRAHSSFGQPGLDAGRGMGVGPAGAGVAVALTGGAPLRVWNADRAGPLRLRLEAFDLSALPMADADTHFSGLIAPGAARLVRLGSSAKEIEISLGPGAAAFLNGGDRAETVFAGERPLSRRLSGAWTNVLFANIGAAPTPVSLDAAPAPAESALVAGAIRKRFFGAAGSLSMRVAAKSGDRLRIAGARGLFIGADGTALRGEALQPTGPGELILDHDAGLAAVWLENAQASPWPSPAPKTLALPASATLEGQAMGFAFSQAQPTLLHLRSSAPVILALEQGGARGAPQLYPAGADLDVYVAAGEAKLFVYSPHDGALAGTIEASARPIVPIGEGLGEAAALAPGGVALFAFEVARAGPVGVGVASDPDRAAVHLLDASGRSLGGGVAQLVDLKPGLYLIEARAPPDGPALTVRPAVVGLRPPAEGPPPDVARRYLELVGLKPSKAP